MWGDCLTALGAIDTSVEIHLEAEDTLMILGVRLHDIPMWIQRPHVSFYKGDAPISADKQHGSQASAVILLAIR